MCVLGTKAIKENSLNHRVSTYLQKLSPYPISARKSDCEIHVYCTEVATVPTMTGPVHDNTIIINENFRQDYNQNYTYVLYDTVENRSALNDFVVVSASKCQRQKQYQESLVPFATFLNLLVIRKFKVELKLGLFDVTFINMMNGPILKYPFSRMMFNILLLVFQNMEYHHFFRVIGCLCAGEENFHFLLEILDSHINIQKKTSKNFFATLLSSYYQDLNRLLQYKVSACRVSYGGGGGGGGWGKGGYPPPPKG